MRNLQSNTKMGEGYIRVFFGQLKNLKLTKYL